MRSIGDGIGSALGALFSAFWAIALGVVTLWAFFLLMGAVTVDDPLWLTVAVGVLGLLAALHFAHLRRALGDHAHDELARRVHALRERRGF